MSKKPKDVYTFFSNLIEDVEELHHFSIWAFGEDYKDLDNGIQIIEAWNKIHGVDFPLYRTGSMRDDAEMMVDLWKSR